MSNSKGNCLSIVKRVIEEEDTAAIIAQHDIFQVFCIATM